MAERRMTAREELVNTVDGEIDAEDCFGIEQFRNILSDYYISRKEPIKSRETPAERARRMTVPLKGMDDAHSNGL